MAYRNVGIPTQCNFARAQPWHRSYVAADQGAGSGRPTPARDMRRARRQQLCCRCLANKSRAMAGSAYFVRMVDMLQLTDIDLRIARENTDDLISVLRHFDPVETQMRTGEREWAFRDARRRCVVATEQDGLDVYRLFENIPGRLGSAVICTHDFNMSVDKILSQMKSTEKSSNTDDDVGYVRMTLTGDGTGTLRFSVPVNGGIAVVTCPAFNICIDAVTQTTRNGGDVLFFSENS